LGRHDRRLPDSSPDLGCPDDDDAILEGARLCDDPDDPDYRQDPRGAAGLPPLDDPDARLPPIDNPNDPEDPYYPDDPEAEGAPCDEVDDMRPPPTGRGDGGYSLNELEEEMMRGEEEPGEEFDEVSDDRYLDDGYLDDA